MAHGLQKQTISGVRKHTSVSRGRPPRHASEKLGRDGLGYDMRRGEAAWKLIIGDAYINEVSDYLKPGGTAPLTTMIESSSSI